MESRTGHVSEDFNAKESSATGKQLRSLALVSALSGNPIEPDALETLTKTCPSPYALIAIRALSHKSPTDARDVEDSLRNAPIRYAATVVDGTVIAFLTYSDAKRFTDNLIDKNKAARCSAAISLPFCQLTETPQQHALVTYCLREHPDEGVHDCKDDVLKYLKSEILLNIDTSSLLHPALKKLAAYDESNQSNLLNTLKVYLEHDRNAQRCANMLYLHRNSLQYRVRRIQEIAGIDLDDPGERAYLRLSFLLSS